MAPDEPKTTLRATFSSWGDIEYVDARTLTEAVVTDPELQELPREIDNFPQFHNVTHLAFRGNKIEHLPSIFITLEQLQYLEISSNRLSCLPEGFGNLRNLISLRLSDNAFELLPIEILRLKKLQVFDISKNNLKVVPDSIGDLTNLRRLDISFNKLDGLPDSLHQLKHLNDIQISHNQLCRLPDCFFVGLRNVINLDISSNEINDLTAPPLCANKLQRLNLSYNLLAAIPEWTFVTCGSLLDLDLSSNSQLLYQSLEDVQNVYFSVGGMRSTLKRINLSGCGLKSRSLEFLTSFKNLIEIRAGNDYLLNDEKSHHKCAMNSIWDLPLNVLTHISNLTELYVPAVGLTILPSNIFELNGLKVIDLQSNELHFLHDSFCQLRSLTKVLLSNNRLVSLPGQFGNLEDLTELRIDSNQLSSLPDSFSQLHQLIYLDLYDNFLEEFIPDSILASPRLKGFDIEENICEATKIVCFTPYDELKTALRMRDAKAKNRVDGTKPYGSGDAPNVELTEDTDYHLKYICESDSSESNGSCREELRPVPDGEACTPGIEDSEVCWDDENWGAAVEDETDWTPPAVTQVSAACKVEASKRYPLLMSPRKIFVKSDLVTYDGQFDEPSC